MIYMGDASWWDNRFDSRGAKLMMHDSKLEEDMKYFPEKGKVLDVACGDGRNSIFLSKRGYEVDAIDFSKVALDRLNNFANMEEQSIRTTQIDLSDEVTFAKLDEYDLVIINHFRLDKSLYPELSNHLKENGVLWVNGFREIPGNNPNITGRDLLSDDDFTGLENCTLESKDTYENGEHKLVRYIWTKK